MASAIHLGQRRDLRDDRSFAIMGVIVFFAEEFSRELHGFCLVGIVPSACTNESGVLGRSLFVHLLVELYFVAHLTLIRANLPSRFIGKIEACASAGIATP